MHGVVLDEDFYSALLVSRDPIYAKSGVPRLQHVHNVEHTHMEHDYLHPCFSQAQNYNEFALRSYISNEFT